MPHLLKSPMRNRDDFPFKTQNSLRLRAGNCCSFPDCGRITSGPSKENANAVTSIGVAAHICAAAPGGRRYRADMSAKERSSIENGIWLCVHHATVIDRDSTTYTEEVLQGMKRSHEVVRADDIKTANGSRTGSDLVAIGPDIVCVGEPSSITAEEWTLHIHNFYIGDLNTLSGFMDGFAQALPADRYVLVNALDDGRTLLHAPSITREAEGYTLHCRIASRFPRTSAQDLPKSYALSPTNDMFLEKGNIAVVSGVEALPQTIRTALSHQKGESPFHCDFGTRLAEYYSELRGSPWFERLLKLEVIRQAAIPYGDVIASREYTPLHCVERVHGVELLAEATKDNWLPVRVDLDVKGIGRWEHVIAIFVPRFPL